MEENRFPTVDELNEMTDEEVEQWISYMIEYWKQVYFDAVYLTQHEDLEIIWRGLSRKEFQYVQNNFEEDAEKEEAICQICLLFPEDIDFDEEIYAGIPSMIATQILTESGFTEDTSKMDYLMTTLEDEMESFENQVSCIIVEAFPHLDIEQVEEWPLEKTMWYYSRSRWILQQLRGLEIETSKKTDA